MIYIGFIRSSRIVLGTRQGTALRNSMPVCLTVTESEATKLVTVAIFQDGRGYLAQIGSFP
jgi:hypothetical protein